MKHAMDLVAELARRGFGSTAVRYELALRPKMLPEHSIEVTVNVSPQVGADWPQAISAPIATGNADHQLRWRYKNMNVHPRPVERVGVQSFDRPEIEIDVRDWQADDIETMLLTSPIKARPTVLGALIATVRFTARGP